ncbi:S26 family signal peptidase [Candidatus Pacearchaeota archaeon]|jgi:signal peptidase I|nr:S26 family signal peptidase [Candidatus Pacearchaeota archaeon]
MKKQKLILLFALIITSLILSYFVGFNQGKDSFQETGLIIKEGNNTYYKHFENYYNVNYGADGNKFFLEIDNPCISVQKIIGESMLPYYENESISILDTCFPSEKLEIGDIISFYEDWNMTRQLHHRIIEINYEKELIKTQGDNLENEDNFISFSQVYGKEIGVLNLLSDEKVVKEINGSADYVLTCVCSSKNILKVCGPDKEQLITDNFVITNDLKEENCALGNE